MHELDRAGTEPMLCTQEPPGVRLGVFPIMDSVVTSHARSAMLCRTCVRVGAVTELTDFMTQRGHAFVVAPRDRFPRSGEGEHQVHCST